MVSELIKLLRQIDIVSFESVKLKNGCISNFYIDIKKAYGHPDALNMISDELGSRIDKNATCIAASGYGGISPASIISVRHGLRLTLVRDQPKGHGTRKWIDGYLPDNKDKAVIVDDVFTTGGTLRRIVEILEPTGAEILGFYAVVKRGDAQLSYKINYLLDSKDLL